jgi:hypothetical protein
MILKYTSVKEIIGRVIDDVGAKLPSHYYDTMLEWIPQGVRMLETKYQLTEDSTGNWTESTEELDPKALYTNNHVVPIPTGVISIIAVEDQFGERVRLAASQIDFKNQSDRYSTGSGGNYDARPTNFQVDVWDHQGVDPATGTEESVPWDGSDLKQVIGGQTNATYKAQGNMIQTSLECMFIKIHYLSLPMDQDGYLMVPDVEEYKQALGFYILRQLIGAGFKHPIWNGPPGWNHYNSMWEKYAARALGVIKYPDIDRMEKLRTGFAERLIPAHHAYNDFFTGIEQTQEIGNI